jgi:hypothetical protein
MYSRIKLVELSKARSARGAQGRAFHPWMQRLKSASLSFHLMQLKRFCQLAIAISVIVILALPFALQIQAPSSVTVSAMNLAKLNKIQLKLLSGFATFELLPASTQGPLSEQGIEAQANNPTSYTPLGFSAPTCAQIISGNVKVNQNCLNISDKNLQGRGQAQNEAALAVDPSNPNHLVAGYNDYRRGDGTCGVSYSVDGGTTWADSTLPNGFTNGATFGAAREYWHASGDPSVAWDTKGNAYFDCQQFMRGTPTTNNPDFSSAIYLYRSTTNGGASWNFPGHPVVEDVDFSGATLQDKPYMTVDNHAGSPFQDRIYVTWTNFAADGTAYIMGSYSKDYGQTFSTPVVVSATTPLCTFTYSPFGIPTPHGNCNENQFSQPFTGSDGALYVVWANYNNPEAAGAFFGTSTDNRNQILLAKSTNGGVSFSTPIKVASYYDLPDCDSYQGIGQDPGRACVPEKGASQHSVFRAANYPAGAASPLNPSTVVVTVGSYISVYSKESNGCIPNGLAGDGINLFVGVKTAGACSNKILLSVSSNGGSTFTGATTDPRSLPTVNQGLNQKFTDQWWQWAAFSKEGKFAVSYYDRQYGASVDPPLSSISPIDETTGYMDISLSSSANLVSFRVQRVTSSSMPLPTEFPNGFGNGVFFGDYSGHSAGSYVNPIWADTRNLDVALCPGTPAVGVAPALCTFTEAVSGQQANDQDIFTTFALP